MSRSALRLVQFAALFLLVATTGLGQAAAGAEVEARRGGVYRAPLLAAPTTLDPALYSDIYSMNVANNLYDGLVKFDHDLNIRPAIARRWKIARDLRTYTFELREGVRFHNGRELTAADVVHSFQRIIDPATKSPAASYFRNIKGAQALVAGQADAVSGLSAPARYTLKIELQEPFAPFLSILAMANAKVVPRDIASEEFARMPIGTGPYRFVSWEKSVITLAPNLDYFGQRSYLEELRFVVYLDGGREQVFADFKEGLLEHAFIPSDEYRNVLSGDLGTSAKLVGQPGLNLIYVGLNQGVAAFADVRVRQAVNYAIDTETIVKQIIGRGSTPALGILPPGLSGFDPNFEGYGYDPEKARALLKQAGYDAANRFPAIELWTVARSDNVRKALQAYQGYLADVGIVATIRVAENWKAFVSAIKDSKAAMFYAAWFADYPDPDNFFYPLVYSASATNRTGFTDATVDELLTAARIETDYHERVELYRSIEKRVKARAPLVAQHVDSNTYLFRPSVRNIQLNPLGIVYLPFHEIWLDSP